MDEQNMSLHDFYYDLPQELIAQDPLEDRSSSRLLVLDRETGNTEHHIFREIINYLNPGDCLVVNNTRLFRQGSSETRSELMRRSKCFF